MKKKLLLLAMLCVIVFVGCGERDVQKVSDISETRATTRYDV